MKLQFYAQIEEVTDSKGAKFLRVVGTTRTKPASPKGDMVIKFTIDVPEASIIPEVTGALTPLNMTAENERLIKGLRQTVKDLR